MRWYSPFWNITSIALYATAMAIRVQNSIHLHCTNIGYGHLSKDFEVYIIVQIVRSLLTIHPYFPTQQFDHFQEKKFYQQA